MKFTNTKQDRQGFDEAIANMISGPIYAANYQFYGHLIGHCKIQFTKDLPAAAGVRFNLDHYEMAINPDMFNAFPLKHRLGVLKHEMLHILFNHVHDKDEGKNKQAMNIAEDCAINQMIERDHLPDGCIFPDNIGPLKEGISMPLPPNLTKEQYYEYIDEDQCDENQDGDGESGEGDGDENSQGQPNGQGKGVVDDHDYQDSSTGDPDLQKDITKQMLDSATDSTAKGRGNLPSNLDKMMALHTRKMQVSWQKILRNIVGNKRTSARRTIMRSDRRFPKREDLRGKTKDRTFGLLVVGDESGSMCDNALTECIGEILHITTVTKTDLDYVPVDTEAHTPMKLSKSQRTFKRSASGGTNLHPALDKAKEANIDYQAIVVITDGGLCPSDVEVFAKTGKKVVWLLESDGHVMPEMQKGRMSAYKLKKSSE